ncbi:MAG TPA: ribonuclease P protein component [Anaerolineaceae bacterium]|nr:ribonuclease P protein component [Anaerolineaceae bacterium]
MKQSNRLTKSSDFKRVRRYGKSFAHPLAVLVVAKGESEDSRAGFITTKSIGNAVKRNRVKRQFRNILNANFPTPSEPVDLLLIAREPANAASFSQKKDAILSLLGRAQLIVSDSSNAGTSA